MGARVSRDDFEWSYTEEPHKTRRKQILAKYPEVKNLMGSDPNLKWQVLAIVTVQVLTACLLMHTSIPLILILAYIFGGVLNHMLSLAIHEAAHNNAFGHSRPLANKLLGLFSNLPLTFPFFVIFKKYHIQHHKHQGLEGMDVDMPSRWEGRLFNTSLAKLLWLVLQPIIYAVRPLFLLPKAITAMDIINLVTQVVFDVVVYFTMGWRSLFYLFISAIMSSGLHPISAHYISAHYMFKKGHETYSYYGPLNAITFNIGYHFEHHDFPNIPGSRLPMLKKMAPEFYENLPHHMSLLRVLYDFVFDPDIGPFSRIKRNRVLFPEEKDVDV